MTCTCTITNGSGVCPHGNSLSASEREREREWWIDPISDFEDEDCDPVLTAYTRHPGQGPLDFQARLIKVVPASEVEKVKQSEFDRGWKAAIEFANAAWKPILNPPEAK